jgi:Pyridoxal phosphate biosynthetic protein PdxA
MLVIETILLQLADVGRPPLNTIHLRFARLAFVLGLAGASFEALSLPSQLVDLASHTRIQADYGKLPLAFEANEGQTTQTARFIVRGQGFGLSLTQMEAVLTLPTGNAEPHSDSHSSVQATHSAHGRTIAPSTVLRMRLAGSNPKSRISGVDRLPGTSNYFATTDSANWRTAVPNYGKVKYAGVYPGALQTVNRGQEGNDVFVASLNSNGTNLVCATYLGGLPFPVCTPAHGTAYDIAGQGIANVGATREATLLAARMASRNHAAKLAAN